jgi:aminoglycoside phosphotransferase (APT) family kinase protein
MDSITKSKISEDQIRRLVKSAFGDEYILESIEELKEGYFNTAYSITAKDGFKTILKVAPSKEIKLMRYEKNIMKAEVDTLDMIKEKTNVPVPKVYLYNSERDIIDNEYFFMEFINGIPLNKLNNSLSDENKEKIYKQIGAYTRQINNIYGDSFGYISQRDRQFENWFDAFTALVEDVLVDGQEASVILPVSYKKLSGIIESRKNILNIIAKPNLIHKDLWAGNIFIDPISFEVTGIVDCERALWADPMMDFIFGFLEDNADFNRG